MLLSDAVDQYQADRRAKGYKPNTVRSDGNTLRSFLSVLGNIQVSSLAQRHMDRYWSAKAGSAPATFNRARAQLSTFFKWCQVRGHLPRDVDLLEGTRKRRVPSTVRYVIPVDRFGEVLDAADNGRDRAILALGLYLFTRISETANIQWRDIDFSQKTVVVYRSKTETGDVLPMCQELEGELRNWRLAYSAYVGEVVRPEWYVTPPFSTPRWTGKEGGGFTLVEAGRLLPTRRMVVATRPIKRVLAKLGVDDRYEGGHTLRRAGAIALYHQLSSVGHDRAIRMCQAMLGHSSIQSTEIYLNLDLDRKARNDLIAGKKMFPEVAPGVVLELGVVDGQESDRELRV